LNRSIIRQGLRDGVVKGGRAAWWMLKIIVPLGFLTLLVDYSGLIGRLEGGLAPAMGLFGLSAAAALPLAIGLLAGIYGAIASMVVLDLGVREMTLVAVFLLMAHNLPQEVLVQVRAGSRWVHALVTRLAAAMAVTWLLSRVLGGARAAGGPAASVPAAAAPFLSLLGKWLLNTGWLCLKITAIIMAVMLVLELLRTMRVVPRVAASLAPLLAVMGLSPNVALLWVTAVVFGLAYGSAVIVEEVRAGDFADEELQRLHLSIGVNHSMVEDPILFLPLGISAFWLWLPRLVAAVLLAHLYGWACAGGRRRKSSPR
jgi:hypothetical protein